MGRSIEELDDVPHRDNGVHGNAVLLPQLVQGGTTALPRSIRSTETNRLEIFTGATFWNRAMDSRTGGAGGDHVLYDGDDIARPGADSPP